MRRNRPRDRRQRWNESHSIGALMFFAIGTFYTAGGVYLFGAIAYMLFVFEILDIKRGWKISDKRPPWADSVDAINEKHGIKMNNIECSKEFKRTHRYKADYEKDHRRDNDQRG